MKASVILNIASGTAQNEDADELCSQIAAKMGTLGWQFTLKANSAAELKETLEGVPPGTDLMIVGGGDGTIAAVAERAMELDIPIAILPLGTMNVFARDLGVPLEINDALGALDNLSFCQVDVAYVNDMIFLNSVVIGAFATLARQRENMRKASGLRSLMLALRKSIRVFRGYDRHSYEVEDDHRKRTVRAGTIQVTNNPLATTLAPLPQRRALTSGQLGCYIDHSRTQVGFAKASIQTLLGGMPADPTVTSFKSDEIVITPKRPSVEVSIDGEARKIDGSLRFQVLPEALKVVGAQKQ